MWFKCDLDICGESVEFEVLMCDGEPNDIIHSVPIGRGEHKRNQVTDFTELLELPHVVKAVMKAYNDYIGE